MRTVVALRNIEEIAFGVGHTRMKIIMRKNCWPLFDVSENGFEFEWSVHGGSTHAAQLLMLNNIIMYSDSTHAFEINS